MSERYIVYAHRLSPTSQPFYVDICLDLPIDKRSESAAYDFENKPKEWHWLRNNGRVYVDVLAKRCNINRAKMLRQRYRKHWRC